MEEWKDIDEKYKVSTEGRVYSKIRNKILKSVLFGTGYYYVTIKGKQKAIHRLVAEAFIENPMKYNVVNHKDENPANNKVENLEWCDAKYNSNYGTRNERISKTLKGKKPSKKAVTAAKESNYKTVYQYTKDLKLVKIWKSPSLIPESIFKRHGIYKCCTGERKTYKGYIWSYNPL